MKAEDFEKLLDDYRHAVLDLDVLTEIEKPDAAEVEMEQAARIREQSARKAIIEARTAALNVGDKMRFSLELLEQIRNEGNRSQLVRVMKIEQHDDGEKTVWVENVNK